MYVVELPKDFFDHIPPWVHTLQMIISSTVLSIIMYVITEYFLKKMKSSSKSGRAISNLEMWEKIRQK